MSATHNLQQITPQARQLGCDNQIILFNLFYQTPQLSLVQFLGRGNCFLYPAVYYQALLFAKTLYFKTLIFSGLMVC